MSSATTIHTYEVGTTLLLSHEEKERLVQFLVDLSRCREEIMGHVKFGARGAFVLRNIHTYENVDDLSPDGIRELASNHSPEARDRVVGYIERSI